jgi:predicted permease
MRRPSRTPSRADSGREFLGLPEPPTTTRLVDLAEDSSETEDDEWGADLPRLRRRTSPPREGLVAAWHNAKKKALASWNALNAFMTVPTWAALISIIIALIPPLQARISDIKPFVQAVKSAGQCSIPVTLVVLGAFFYTPPSPALPDDDDEEDNATGNGRGGIAGWVGRKLRALQRCSRSSSATQYPGENRTVFVACVSRMIVVPLVFLPVIAIVARYDFFKAAEDPIFILCAVLLVSSPTALTLAQLTQAASGDAFERLISKTISISYAVLTPPLTLVYVVVGLFFTRL